ncbi:GNAT family N-acetyltransferase [Pseudarthrobacter sp. NPDC058196]|uniref:GNAT family N-acetyltransferase n=1 Tax=Pseudarthrobacter sp. NPDC058196 TaxID=3346376 RepID=UPI0036D9D92C
MISQADDRIVLVAAVQDQPVGIGKTHFHKEPAGKAPAGHYLGGVVVSPAYRRLGVGAALTRARMEWVWSRSSSVYYFANENNAASITMHQALGFMPVGRFAEIHGVTADDGRSQHILVQAAR